MPSKDRSENVLQSFRFAFAGIVHAVTHQRNVRIHFLAAAVVVVLAGLLRVSPVEWAILILTVGFVIATEMMNTAIEAVVDLASPDFHELAKVAKDVAAGAVLVAAVAAVIIGALIFGPGLKALFGW